MKHNFKINLDKLEFTYSASNELKEYISNNDVIMFDEIKLIRQESRMYANEYAIWGCDYKQDKGDENVFHGFDAGKGQDSHFFDGMLSVQAVSIKQEKAEYQSRQNGNIKTNADHQGNCKKCQYTDFNHNDASKEFTQNNAYCKY